MRLLSKTSLALAVLFLAGCAGNKVANETNAKRVNVEAQASAASQSLRDEVRKTPPLVESVGTSYIGKSTVAVSKEVSLPKALQKNVNTTLMFPERALTLSMFAERISRATGIPTKVNADCYLPANQLIPGGKGGAAAPSAAPTAVAGSPFTASQLQAPSTVTVEIPGNFSGSLPTLLQIVSERIGINTRVNDDGTLEFYRLVTKAFTLPSATGTTDATSSVGQTAQGAGGGFSAASSISSSSKLDPSSRLVAAIRAMQTQAGTDPVFVEASGTVVITDIVSVMERIEKFLEQERRSMTRQIIFEIQTLRVTSKRTGETGFDLSGIYESLSKKYGVTVLGVPSGASNSAGSVQVGVLQGTNRWAGSAAFIKELLENGTNFTQRNQTLGTTNRVPAMHALTTEFDYVGKTTAQASGTSGAVALGVETKSKTLGSILTFTPTVVSDNAMFIDFSISESAQNTPPQPYAVGQGASQVSVQLTSILGEVIRERRVARNGETLVLTGIDNDEEEEARRGMTENPSLLTGGGRTAAKRSSTRTVILVTVRMSDRY
jgi:type IVB pilus formation R64 PilN family outer membrane protein